jgi:tetrahydromethanopterin S-methyltransferase subunit F
MPAGPERRQQTVELDLIGAIVWEQCGRNRRVSEMVEHIRERFRIIHREAELSVSTKESSFDGLCILCFLWQSIPVFSGALRLSRCNLLF